MTTPNSTTEPDVVDLLLQQHDQIKSMFAQLQTTTGTAKRDLFDELVRLLAVHESAEESVVHPMATSGWPRRTRRRRSWPSCTTWGSTTRSSTAGW